MKTIRILALSIAAGAMVGGIFHVETLRADAGVSADGGYYCLAHPHTGECALSWIPTCWCTPI